MRKERKKAGEKETKKVMTNQERKHEFESKKTQKTTKTKLKVNKESTEML